MQRKIEIKLAIYTKLDLPSDEIADDVTTALLQWDESLYDFTRVEDVNEEEVP